MLKERVRFALKFSGRFALHAAVLRGRPTAKIRIRLSPTTPEPHSSDVGISNVLVKYPNCQNVLVPCLHSPLPSNCHAKQLPVILWAAHWLKTYFLYLADRSPWDPFFVDLSHPSFPPSPTFLLPFCFSFLLSSSRRPLVECVADGETAQLAGRRQQCGECRARRGTPLSIPGGQTTWICLDRRPTGRPMPIQCGVNTPFSYVTCSFHFGVAARGIQHVAEPPCRTVRLRSEQRKLWNTWRRRVSNVE